MNRGLSGQENGKGVERKGEKSEEMEKKKKKKSLWVSGQDDLSHKLSPALFLVFGEFCLSQRQHDDRLVRM